MIYSTTSFLHRIGNHVIVYFIPLMLSCSDKTLSTPEIWKLENLEEIGGHKPLILGNPQVVKDEYGLSLSFNGIDDGLILPVNPVASFEQFTVEVLFKPDADGLAQQRFVHFQDENNNRGLIETRLLPDGRWFLDTYLHDGKTDSGLTLADRSLLHPAGQWYWAALVYDGETMTHYLNGQKEDEGGIIFGPMSEGKMSVGVRLNQVFWYKGLIRELRFHEQALDEKQLRVPGNN